MSSLVWIIIAIVVVVVIVAIIAAVLGSRKRNELHRNRAGELREQAAAQATAVQQREAEARETEARAEQARAEADRLRAEAQDKSGTAAEYREDQAAKLREADKLDPDVNVKSDDYVDPTERQTGTPEDYAPEHRAGGTPDGNDTGATRA
jgi:type II secretory pathway pseudopilin PulG